MWTHLLFEVRDASDMWNAADALPASSELSALVWLRALQTPATLPEDFLWLPESVRY